MCPSSALFAIFCVLVVSLCTGFVVDPTRWSRTASIGNLCHQRILRSHVGMKVQLFNNEGTKQRIAPLFAGKFGGNRGPASRSKSSSNSPAAKGATATPDALPAKKVKDDVIEVQGRVTESLPGAMFRVEIEPSKQIVLCTISGKIRKNYVKILVGDRVTAEISVYDLTKGRISFRHK